MEVLSEHQCQGWLEGYLLTGRHGLFNCYEAFIHIVDSMFNQHAKWLKVTADIPWRRPIASLNYLLSSHVWRQDHNGFTHQDPGFIDHVVNKKAEVIRVYLPPDANTLLSVADHCLRSRNYVNVIVAGKQPAPQLAVDGRGDPPLHPRHRDLGLGQQRRGRRARRRPGLRRRRPDARDARRGRPPPRAPARPAVRVVNVVDLMRLQPESEHPHGLSDREFDTLFTTDRPIVFAYHGYPWLIHRLTYRRTNHANLHVRGYKEEGTTTTPFDMVMLNDLDRFHLVIDVIDRVPGLGAAGRAPPPADGRPPARRPGRTRARGRGRAGDPRLDLAGLTRTARPHRCASSSSTPARAASSCGSSTTATRSSPRPTCRRPRGAADAGGRRRARSAASATIDAVGHRIVHGGTSFPRAGPHRRRPSSRACAALTDLAPLHQPKSLAAARRGRGGRCPTCRRSPASTRPSTPACRRPPRPTRCRREWRKRWDAAPLRLPRPVARLRVAARGRAARPPGRRAAARDLPPRRRRVARGGPRRPLGRHDDGLHAARGPGDGDPLGRASTRASCSGSRSTSACRAAELAATLEHRSGLLGLAGTADMRAILAAEAAGDEAATLAVGVYLHRLRASIAAMAAALGGLDALVFTGGVGEHAPAIRAGAAAGLGFLGVAARPGGQRERDRRPRDRRAGSHGPHARRRRPRGPRDRPRGARRAGIGVTLDIGATPRRMLPAWLPSRRPATSSSRI